MSLKPVIKGAIFKMQGVQAPYYFLGFQCGTTRHKDEAYVFNCGEIRRLKAKHWNWALKNEGKWILVYE